MAKELQLAKFTTGSREAVSSPSLELCKQDQKLEELSGPRLLSCCEKPPPSILCSTEPWKPPHPLLLSGDKS